MWNWIFTADLVSVCIIFVVFGFIYGIPFICWTNSTGKSSWPILVSLIGLAILFPLYRVWAGGAIGEDKLIEPGSIVHLFFSSVSFVFGYIMTVRWMQTIVLHQ